EGLGDGIELGGLGDEGVEAVEPLGRAVARRHDVAAGTGAASGRVLADRFLAADSLPAAGFLAARPDVGQVNDAARVGVGVDVGGCRACSRADEQTDEEPGAQHDRDPSNRAARWQKRYSRAVLPRADERATDYLVIGSGIAGLYFALRAAEHGQVVMVTKKRPSDTATDWAQGGIAAVLGDDDTLQGHIDDTLLVGDGLCKPDIVEMCVREGPAHVRNLATLGVPFERDARGEFELGREGGHSARRVAHHKDTTGHAIHAALFAAVERHP